MISLCTCYVDLGVARICMGFMCRNCLMAAATLFAVSVRNRPSVSVSEMSGTILWPQGHLSTQGSAEEETWAKLIGTLCKYENYQSKNNFICEDQSTRNHEKWRADFSWLWIDDVLSVVF